MKYLLKFGKKTDLRVFGGGARVGSEERRPHYNWLKATEDTENDIEIAVSFWSEGFKELFPEKEFISLQVTQILRELIKKADLLEGKESKIAKLKMSSKNLKEKFLEIAVVKFLANLKLAVNEYPEHFEAVEEKVLIEKLITVSKVFEYIKAQENRGRLNNNIFTQSSKELDRWEKGANISVKSLLNIKEDMIGDGVDKRRVNTYILLIYICNILKVEDEKDIETEDKAEGVDWEELIDSFIPLILYHSEEIGEFLKKQKNKKIGE